VKVSDIIRQGLHRRRETVQIGNQVKITVVDAEGRQYVVHGTADDQGTITLQDDREVKGKWMYMGKDVTKEEM